MGTITEYRDFELAVSSDGSKTYAQVRCPAGESERVAFKLPFDPENMLLRIENAILRGGGRTRAAGDRLESDLRKIGEGLFRSLMPQSSQIQQLYSTSRAMIPQGERLRLKLRVDPALLAALPWEFFYDNLVVQDFLALHGQTSVVRYTPMAKPMPQLAVDGPLRILGMVSNPRGNSDLKFEELDVATERARIDKAIHSLHEKGAIDFQWVLGESASDLQDALALRGPWHAFHFIGHGGIDADSEEGFLVMAREDGEPDLIAGSYLRSVLSMHPSMRLVVLNCCDSGRGPTSVAKSLVIDIPAVVAMQYPISDVAAIEMSSGFYTALAGGESIDGAVSSARIRMRGKSNTEWGIPILHMRSPDGRLFERGEKRVSVPTTTDTGTALPVLALPIAAPAAKPKPLTPPGGGLEELLAAAEERDLELAAELAGEDAVESWSPEKLVQIAEYGERERLASSKDDRLRKRLGAVHFLLCARYRNENANKAFVSISAAVNLDPGEANYLFTRADMFARSDQLDLALADITQALVLAPGRAEYHWVKGLVCLLFARTGARDELIDEAVKAFDTAIALDPKVAKYHSSRGAARVRLGKLPEAMQDLDSALSLDPSDANSLFNRAKLRLQAGDRLNAKKDLRAATRLGHTAASRELQKLGDDEETRH